MYSFSNLESVKWSLWKLNSSFCTSMGERVNLGISLNKLNYMQQTSPIQFYWILDWAIVHPPKWAEKEGWSARLSWRRCWRPWMDPARLKSRVGPQVEIWNMLMKDGKCYSCFVVGLGAEETIFVLYEYLNILPSSHNALCTISHIFLWTVFVIFNKQSAETQYSELDKVIHQNFSFLTTRRFRFSGAMLGWFSNIVF